MNEQMQERCRGGCAGVEGWAMQGRVCAAACESAPRTGVLASSSIKNSRQFQSASAKKRSLSVCPFCRCACCALEGNSVSAWPFWQRRPGQRLLLAAAPTGCQVHRPNRNPDQSRSWTALAVPIENAFYSKSSPSGKGGLANRPHPKTLLLAGERAPYTTDILRNNGTMPWVATPSDARSLRCPQAP